MAPARLAVLAALTTLLVQCAPPPGTPPPSSSRQISVELPPVPPTETPPTTETPRPPTVGPVTAAGLATTWRPGCPVTPAELRLVELDYQGFDGMTHRGRLVVNRDITAQVIEVFAQLYRMRYPIERMQTPDHYPGAEDELSMRDNNTSAYNCRDIPGSGNWSLHAYGRAVDINPKVNPYIDDAGDLQPANAGPWLDRTRTDPGVLHDGDPVVTAFTDRGWRWGGHWHNPRDYQHFELR